MVSPESFVVARILHVVGVVLWIGGVSFVTTVLIPALRRLPRAEDRLRLFEAIEGKFAAQAKVLTVVTGVAGFYMLEGVGGWSRYQDPSSWWLHLMTTVWLLFTVMLFVLEPFFLHRKFKAFAERDPEKAFRLLHRLHVVLLAVSLLAIIGGVAGIRGYLRFG